MSTRNETIQQSAPVPIAAGGHHRARSGSGSSDSSAGTPPPITPRSLNISLPRMGATGAGQGTSPIMSYILGGQSPTATVKSPITFPFTQNPFCGTAVEDDDKETPVTKHSRRASVSSAQRFPAGQQSAPGTLHGAQTDRGSGILRRLSIGGTFARPQIGSPTSANAPKPKTPPPIIEVNEVRPVPRTLPRAASPRAGKRRATLGVTPPPRAPSPMGERILKGHFDGFN